MDFSFAIVNWNTRDLLDRCLASLQQAIAASDFSCEVLVADNASSDGSAAMVRDRYPDVVLVETGANLGFAGGHEPLFRRSRGRLHVLVNSDVELLPGCLEAVMARMDADTDIGVLGPKVRFPDGSVQPSCRRFPSLLHQAIDASGLNRIFPRHPFWNAYKMGDFDHSSARDVDQVMGSLFVIRRKLMEQIGGLDTDFFMYYEEVDYCFRAKQAGWRVFFEPAAEVIHVGGASAEQVKVHTIRRTYRSMRHYFEKHRGFWSWLVLMPILSLDSVTHVAFACLRRRKPLLTAKAYGLALVDLVLRRPA
jgi:GT2 family glycosyltransferase